MNLIQGAIITTIIGLAVNILLTAKSFINKLEIELKQIKINKELIAQSGYKKLYYTIELVVINPVKFQVKVESILLKVYFFKSLFGTANTVRATTIAPLKKTIIPVTFEIDLQTLPATLFTSITEAIDKKNLMLMVQGKMNFTEGTIDFNFYKEVSV